ncbi:MAG: hypothetical protein ACJ74Z_03485, partial [Bryobacteraceae bacterium]
FRTRQKAARAFGGKDLTGNAMPLSAVVKTPELGSKCGVLVPTRFLSCPSCLGLQKKRERWVVPGKPKTKRKPVQELSFFDDAAEYPR